MVWGDPLEGIWVFEWRSGVLGDERRMRRTGGTRGTGVSGWSVV